MQNSTRATFPLQLRWVIVACLLAAAGPAIAVPEAQSTPPPLLSDVPRTHPAYAAMSLLEGHCFFTGHPAKTFAGTRLLTRYEFAVATHRVLGDLKSLTSAPTPARLSGARIITTAYGKFRGPGGRRPFGESGPVVTEATMRETGVWLRALRDEFSSEFAMLGVDLKNYEQLIDQCLAPDASAIRNMRERFQREFDQRPKTVPRQP